MTFYIMASIMFTILSATLESSASERWYGDNNMNHENGSVPLDFEWRYNTQNVGTWSFSRNQMSCYVMNINAYSSQFKYVSQYDEIWNFSKQCADVMSGIPVCLNTTEATFASYVGKTTFPVTDNAITRLLDCGWNVESVALQSVLSKPYNGAWSTNDLPDRIGDVVAFFQYLRPRRPDIEIGLICAMPAQGKDYEFAYAMLKDALSSAGYELDFLLNDYPNNWPAAGNNPAASWDDLAGSTGFAQSLGWEVGWFMSAYNVSSAEAYRNAILDGLDAYRSESDYPKMDMILTDAFDDVPEYSAPDDPDPATNPNGYTQLGTFLMVDEMLLLDTFTFDSDGEAEGWYGAGGVSGFNVSSGSMNYTKTASGFVRTGDVLSRRINCNHYDRVKIRMKNQTGASQGTLYYITDESPIWTGKSFSVSTGSGFIEYTINLSSHSQWSGMLKHLRIDLPGGSGEVSIDYVMVGD